MRTVFAFLVMSVDGYYADLSQALEWQTHDEEARQFALEQLGETDILVLGRLTYEQMAAFWPTPAARELDAGIATAMDMIPKIVISRTLTQADWANARILSGEFEEELFSLKAQDGKAIAVLGSSALTAGLLRMGLVSELRIMVTPFILGGGRSMLAGMHQIGLKLTRVTRFEFGKVLLCYKPPTVPAGYVKHPDGHVTFGGWSGHPYGWGFPPDR